MPLDLKFSRSTIFLFQIIPKTRSEFLRHYSIRRHLFSIALITCILNLIHRY